jgi:hypothetical protein
MKNIKLSQLRKFIIYPILVLLGACADPTPYMNRSTEPVLIEPTLPNPGSHAEVMEVCELGRQIKKYSQTAVKTTDAELNAAYDKCVEKNLLIVNERIASCNRIHPSTRLVCARMRWPVLMINVWEPSFTYDNGIKRSKSFASLIKSPTPEADELINILKLSAPYTSKYDPDADEWRTIYNLASIKLGGYCKAQSSYSKTVEQNEAFIKKINSWEVVQHECLDTRNSFAEVIKQQKAVITDVLAYFNSNDIEKLQLDKIKQASSLGQSFFKQTLTQQHFQAIAASTRKDISLYILNNYLVDDSDKSALYEHIRRLGTFEEIATIIDLGDLQSIRRATEIASKPEEREKAKRYALRSDFLVSLSDSELNEAYKNASTADKVKVEKIVVPRFAQRLANIKYTVANAKTQAYGGNDTSLWSQLGALFGSKIGVSADTPVTYSVQLNPALLKVQGNYNFKAQIVLKATGKETWQTHCMWPLPAVCDRENNAAVKTYTKNIAGTVSGNTTHTGSAAIEWKPKFSNKSMGGLETTFVTNDVSVSLVGFTIEAQN